MKKYTIAELIAIEPLQLRILTNSTFEEQKCLYDQKDLKPILIGDYYHDKINEQIEGFLQCLNYMGIPYELEKMEVTPMDYNFKSLDFINED